MPPLVIHVYHQTRVKLGDGVQVIVLLFKILISAASAVLHAVIDVVPPRHIKHKRASWLQRSRQVDAHHRFVDGVLQRPAGFVPYVLDFEPTVKGRLEALNATETAAFIDAGFPDLVAVAVQGTDILIQLQPQVAQFIGAVVFVENALFPVDALVLIVQGHFDVVVDLLLPVFMPRSSARCAVNIGSRQRLAELLEFAFIDLRWHILQGLLCQGKRNCAGPHEDAQCSHSEKVLSHGKE